MSTTENIESFSALIDQTLAAFPAAGAGSRDWTAQLLSPERAQRFELVMHLIANLAQPLVICGPDGVGKTTFMGLLAERAFDGWRVVTLSADGRLMHEDIIARIAERLALTSTTEKAVADYLQQQPPNKSVLVLSLDDAGKLAPGVINSLWQFARAYPALRLVLALSPDEIHLKNTTDSIALGDCRFVDIPALTEAACEAFLRRLSVRPPRLLLPEEVSAGRARSLYQASHGVPGRIIQLLNKKKPARAGTGSKTSLRLAYSLAAAALVFAVVLVYVWRQTTAPLSAQLQPPAPVLRTPPAAPPPVAKAPPQPVQTGEALPQHLVPTVTAPTETSKTAAAPPPTETSKIAAAAPPPTETSKATETPLPTETSKVAAAASPPTETSKTAAAPPPTGSPKVAEAPVPLPLPPAAPLMAADKPVAPTAPPQITPPVEAPSPVVAAAPQHAAPPLPPAVEKPTAPVEAVKAVAAPAQVSAAAPRVTPAHTPPTAPSLPAAAASKVALHSETTPPDNKPAPAKKAAIAPPPTPVDTGKTAAPPPVKKAESKPPAPPAPVPAPLKPQAPAPKSAPPPVALVVPKPIPAPQPPTPPPAPQPRISVPDVGNEARPAPPPLAPVQEKPASAAADDVWSDDDAPIKEIVSYKNKLWAFRDDAPVVTSPANRTAAPASAAAGGGQAMVNSRPQRPPTADALPAPVVVESGEAGPGAEVEAAPVVATAAYSAPINPPRPSAPPPPVFSPRPAVAPAAAPPAAPAPASDGGLPGGDWLLAQPSQAYTLRIMSARDPASVRALLDRYPAMRGRLAAYKSHNGTTEMYTIYYGAFSSLSEANQAAAALPAYLGKPVPRQIHLIQQEAHSTQRGGSAR